MDQLFKVFWSFKSEVKESREALPRSFFVYFTIPIMRRQT